MGKRNSIILKILVSFLEYENTALTLPESMVALLWIQYTLLNLSYIFQYNKESWTYILVLLARPSIILSLDYIEYIVIGYLLLWLIFFFFQNNFGASLINLINDLLKVSLLNFILESMTSTLGFAIGIIICLQQFLDLLCLQGTLSIITKNFQVPIINILSYLRFIFNLLLVYLNQFGYSSLLIQFLGITSSFIQFLETNLYNQYRSQQLRNFIAFIQISTILLGILEIITKENKYSIILIPLILRMFQNKPLPYIKETDPIILASIELQNDDIFQCFQLISNLENENIIRLAKSQLLQKQYTEKINIKIQSQQSNIISLNGVCKQLIENDFRNQFISENLNKLIEMKLKVFYNYKSISFLQIFEFVQQVSKVQQQIEECYKSYTCSTMIQSLYVFFYSEIQNNFLKAQEIQNSLTTTIESQIKFHDSLLSKLIYIIYNYHNNQLTIKQVSSNAPTSFYSKQIDDLVPDGIREWHSCLVNQFIINGRSKYIRNFSQNYIVNGQYLENIQFAIDLIFNGDLDFICLIQPTLLQTKTIVVNQNYIITALSEELCEFQSLSMYLKKGVQVSKYIPKITQITESCYIENMIVIYSEQIISANNLRDEDTEINYFCDVQVDVKKLQNQIIYLIIQFDNFKRLLTKKNDVLLEESNNQIDEFGKSIPNETEQSGITEPYEFNEEEYQKIQTYQYKFLSENIPITRERIFTPREDEVSLVKFERKTKRFKSQFKKSQFQEEQLAQINEVQSQVSSLKMFRNSKFFRKYDLYDKYINHLPYEKLHKLIIALIVVITLSQLIFIIIQLSDVSLLQLADDIELLKIKNLLFQPLEVFLVTRWTLFNYKNMLTENQMTQQDYDIKQQFARSNLDLGYDQLNLNIESVLFKSQLQPELQNKFINAYQYIDTYKNEQYNVTLRGAISILINFQYTLKMNYVIERTVGIDTPQVFYSYKNYKLLNDITTELNQDVELSTLQRGDIIVYKVQTIFLIQQIYLILLLLLIIILNLIINKGLMLCINFKQFVQDREIELEIERLKLLQVQINTDFSAKFSYKLDIEIKEQQFQSIENTQTLGKLKQQEKNRITNLFFFIYLLLFYLFFTSNSIISFFLKRSYLQKYSQTTSYITGFSNLGIDIPCMFAQREILYGRNRLMYLTQTDFDYVLQRIQTALYNTIQFGDLDFDFTQILVTEQFSNYYYHMQYSNLCEHIPESIKEKSLQLCSQIFNSNMNLGLKAILIQIQNLISTEMEINKFFQRNSTSPNELEGVFILSQIIKQINEQFFNDLKDLTQDLVQTVYIINIVYLLIVILFGIFWIKSFALKFLQHSKNIIQIIQTIPSYSLFNNDTFERALRRQINKN